MYLSGLAGASSAKAENSKGAACTHTAFLFSARWESSEHLQYCTVVFFHFRKPAIDFKLLLTLGSYEKKYYK